MTHSIKNSVKKIFNVVNNVLDYIKKIEDKHPLIVKCVVIMLVVVVISIATAAAAYAAKTGDTQASTNAINMAIGFLDNINLKDYSSFDIIEAKAYLIKMREGNIGDFPFSEESQKIANSALKVIKTTIEEYKNTHDTTTANALYTWFETGSKMIITNLTQYANTTRITLGSIK
jgi:type II secretory pathway pseudopilin PulG